MVQGIGTGKRCGYKIYFERCRRARSGRASLLVADKGGFGKPDSVTIVLSGSVHSGDPLLSSKITAIDFGINTPCQTQDTTITLLNTGCDTLIITAANFGGSNFSLTG